MNEKIFELLDALYNFMSPSLRYEDKEKWKQDTLKRLSNKSEQEIDTWLNTMWEIINYKE